MGVYAYLPDEIAHALRLKAEGWDMQNIANLMTKQFGRPYDPERLRHMLYRERNRGRRSAPKPARLSPPEAALAAKKHAGPMVLADPEAELARNQRILLISDMHHPYSHPDTVDFLAALKQKYQPTRVICLGDEVDHHAMSFHDSDPDLPSAGDELQKAIQGLRPIYELFPEMDLVDSNHGSMVYRKGKHHGIPRKYLRSYGEVLEAPAGWVWHMDMLIPIPGGNQLYVHHGINKDVMKVVAQRGVCVVQGHYHTEFRIGYIGNPNHLLWGLQIGCLIDGESLAFAYDKNNLGRPIIGTGLVLDGRPHLAPMTLNRGGRWNGEVP
jgi:hypothetical protein